jgi:hypothetical protein
MRNGERPVNLFVMKYPTPGGTADAPMEDQANG